ncbi:MAG: hypothetical protein WAT39_07175, partial [Planctomycetota bacterium]
WSRDRPPCFVVRRETTLLGWQVLARDDGGRLADAGHGTFAVQAATPAASVRVALFVAGGRVCFPDLRLCGRP